MGAAACGQLLRRPALGQRRRRSPPLPAAPHVVGVPPGELADVLVHVLEALLGLLQLLLQRAHCHRHPARGSARRGLPGAQRKAPLGNGGERPRPRAARPPLRPAPPTANGRARRERVRPAGQARRRRPPITVPRGRLACRPTN